jgi:hypothetical protein
VPQFVHKINDVAIYDLYDSTKSFATVFYGVNEQDFIVDSLHNGKLNIKYIDTVNRVIAGTFYFDAVHPQTGEVVKITEGRFDGKYTY